MHAAVLGGQIARTRTDARSWAIQRVCASIQVEKVVILDSVGVHVSVDVDVAVAVAVAVGPICPQESVSDGVLIVGLAMRGVERAGMCGCCRCRCCGRGIVIVGQRWHCCRFPGNGGDVRSAWAGNPR